LTTKSWGVFYLAAEIILLSIILSKFFGCGFAALGIWCISWFKKDLK